MLVVHPVNDPMSLGFRYTICTVCDLAQPTHKPYVIYYILKIRFITLPQQKKNDPIDRPNFIIQAVRQFTRVCYICYILLYIYVIYYFLLISKGISI